MKNLLSNWKTTSAGLTMIIGTTVHLVFAVKAGKSDETTWTVSLTAIVAGLGLLFSGDSSSSAQAHEETKQMVDHLQTQVDQVKQDTMMLANPNQPPKV